MLLLIKYNPALIVQRLRGEPALTVISMNRDGEKYDTSGVEVNWRPVKKNNAADEVSGVLDI